MKISACLITLNEEKNLPRCLRSLQDCVDEIVIVDSGSIDQTPQIAAQFSARFIHQTWLGYVEQKNFAIQEAHHPWILSIDADEELSPELRTTLHNLRQNFPSSPPNGYQVGRVVFYRGKWIRHGDWYPDRLVRLFQKDHARFVGGRIHERLELPGPTPLLEGDLYHYTYTDEQDRQERIEKYARLWAETAWEKGKKTSFGQAWYHALFRFLKGYVLRRGFLDGTLGWEIAFGNAREVYLKYRILEELNRVRT